MEGAEQALAIWRLQARRRPGDVEVLAGLAGCLLEHGEPREALEVLAAAAARHPGHVGCTILTGHALLGLDALGPAIGAFYHALQMCPGQATAHASIATALLKTGATREADWHAREAFRLAPTPAHATTLSCVLIDQGMHEEALAAADCGIEIRPACGELWINRSIALEGLGRAEAALAAAREALSISRTAVIEHHVASLLLSQGQLTAEAWDLYEARLRLPPPRRWPEDARRWRGEDVRGKTILLHAEQGLGDTLQFVRYVPLVAALGATVVLVVQPALRRLLSHLAGVAELRVVGDRLPVFDVYAPLLSLPGLFGTTLDSIPPAIPYELPLARLPGGRLRAGLVWAGSTAFVADRRRSMPAELLWRLREVEGVEWFSLQIPRVGLPDGIVDLMDGVDDLADTAARVAGLDLVITVDTAVAHLAATMGKPVWLLSRFRGCWRWLSGRRDSPWYPSVTIYRQPSPGDWETVVDAVRADLERLRDEGGDGCAGG